jgi:hypothetical protein
MFYLDDWVPEFLKENVANKASGNRDLDSELSLDPVPDHTKSGCAQGNKVPDQKNFTERAEKGLYPQENVTQKHVLYREKRSLRLLAE